MEALRKNQKRIISFESAKKLVIMLILVFLFDFFLFPMPVLANDAVEDAKINEKLAGMEILNNEDSDNVIIEHLPDIDVWQVKYTSSYTLTAYNSEVDQCDDSPCITANGFDVCEHGIEDTIAANFLKFGTKVRIPDLFGDKVFVVRDRMNKRYPNRIDIWMLEKQDAKQFGVKLAKIEILQ